MNGLNFSCIMRPAVSRCSIWTLLQLTRWPGSRISGSRWPAWRALLRGSPAFRCFFLVSRERCACRHRGWVSIPGEILESLGYSRAEVKKLSKEGVVRETG